ncbi:MAG: phosphoglucomutase/phosphomannomutase family protein [Actinomycetota bacterium]
MADNGIKQITFGTDGWRGVIAADFTFDNVRLVTQAVCDYVISESRKRVTVTSPPRGEDKGEGAAAQMTKNGSSSPDPSPPRGEDKGEGAAPTLVIGYDTRFLSDKFAREAACVAAANGIKVLLTEEFAPTPAISQAVVDSEADGAVVFTASHNPYKYNGLKFKASYGGSASPVATGAIEKCLRKNIAAGRQPLLVDFDEAIRGGSIELFDPKTPYLVRLAELVDMEIVKNGGMGVVVDPMYGAGQGYLREFFQAAGCPVSEIHDWRDPYFGGVAPEPLDANLEDLGRAVSAEYPLGVALDGDADRVSAVDVTGDFINPHRIFALILQYLHKVKGLSGDVVKTVSTTGLIDLMAAAYGLHLHETPIGFKYVCDLMISGDVLIGGEESGGIGVKGHLPERDGMLIGALLTEMMNYYGKPLGQIYADLETKHGVFLYDRTDVEIDEDHRDAILGYLERFNPTELDGVVVDATNTTDGFKFCLADASWLMIRPSGTEAVVRIYAEAGSRTRVEQLLARGGTIIKEALA